VKKEFGVKCTRCGHRMPYAASQLTCTQCGNDWLDADFDLNAAAAAWQAELKSRPFTLWRYWELLPIKNSDNIVSMGEGGTPLLKAENLGLMLGHRHIYFKDERQGPTSSFKDRQASVAISAFKEAGITEAVVSSTGNVAISYSAYCARAGIKLWAFLTSTVPADKMREVALYGTEVVKVTSTYDRTKTVANQFASHKGLVIDRGVRSIAAKESMKTVSFEIAEQLGQAMGGRWRAPDWYIQAVSGGLGPVGVWKGFQELHQMGLIDRLPKLAIIQATGCAPIVNSFKAGLAEAENVSDPQTRITTVATGSPGAVYPFLRTVILEHGGAMESVSDDEAFRAMHVMAKMDGISMEPAAAMACAGLFKLLNRRIIQPDEVVVVNVSGHTFPVEKHLLDEQRMHSVGTAEAAALTRPAAPREGLMTALNRLDGRVNRVAIIEDEPDAARLLRRILQAHGQYQIFEANNGRDGLELIRHERPDLILLDLMMPEMDGFTLLEILKKEEEDLRNVPVIVVTAKELSPAEKRRLDGQVESLLQKGSFMEEELMDNILGALG
jgi:threonine synthase